MSKRKKSKSIAGGCFRVLLLLGILLAIGFAALWFSSDSDDSPTRFSKSGRPSKASHQSVQSTQQSSDERTIDVTSPANKTSQPNDSSTDKDSERYNKRRRIIMPDRRDVWNEFSGGSHELPEIALTFDAGASAEPTPKILDTLMEHNLKATFFLTGRWIERNPHLVRRIADEGHEIGNHTYSHKRLTTLNAEEIASEADRTEQLVLELTGQSTKPLLRVPYGDRNKYVLEKLSELGYKSIYWDIDSWDSVKKGITSMEIKERVLERIRNGSIVLLHCGSSETADALDSLLDEIETAGYRQVTVSELLQ